MSIVYYCCPFSLTTFENENRESDPLFWLGKSTAALVLQHSQIFNQTSPLFLLLSSVFLSIETEGHICRIFSTDMFCLYYWLNATAGTNLCPVTLWQFRRLSLPALLKLVVLLLMKSLVMPYSVNLIFPIYKMWILLIKSYNYPSSILQFAFPRLEVVCAYSALSILSWDCLHNQTSTSYIMISWILFEMLMVKWVSLLFVMIRNSCRLCFFSSVRGIVFLVQACFGMSLYSFLRLFLAQ